MNKLQKRLTLTAYITLNLFLVALPAHATYSYLDNTGKLDNLSVDHNK